MIVSKIKTVTEIMPLPENLEEFERRKAQAFIRILRNRYPTELLDLAFEKLEEELKQNN